MPNEPTLGSLFDCVSVISLRSRNDRRRDATRALSQAGLKLGTKDIRFFDAIRPAEAGNFPSVGARGCFLSHLAILEECVQNRTKSVLILEDDVQFISDIHNVWPSIYDQLVKKNWSVFYGGYSEKSGHRLSFAPYRVISVDYNQELCQAHCVAFRGPAIAECAHYLKEMIQRPAGSCDGGPMHVDGAYSWYRRHHPDRLTLVASPPIAHQRPSRSDIYENHAWYDRATPLRPVVSTLRRIKARLISR